MTEQAIEVQNRSYVVYRRLLGYLKPYLMRFFAALGAMVIYGVTDGAIPLILKKVLDDIFGARNEEMLWMLVTAIVIFAIVRAVFGFCQKYLSATVGLRIVKDIRDEINLKLLNLSPSFFGREGTGSHISRMTNDALLVRTALTDAASALLRDSIRIIALLCTAIYLDPILALIAFVGFPLALYPIILFGRKVRGLSRVGQDQFGGLTALLQETIVGHKVVQAFCREDFEQNRFSEENQRVTRTREKAEKYGALSAPTNEAVASLAVGAVVVYGGLSVIGGVRTQGDFIAFITAVFLLYEPMKKIARVNNVIQTGVAAAERIFSLLDIAPDIQDSPEAVDFDGNNTRIEYRNVSFRYQPDNGSLDSESDLVLDNVSVTVDPGETLALVGMSGGGKSTSVSLLPRFYDPVSGQICVGGKDIRDYTLKSLRQAISVVDQHTFLFNDTLRNNIAYGNLNANEEDIEQAAKSANAHSFISKLPQGYKTIIGEQGFRLSGGERARIAIARALLKNAPILILDEATAALDSESEKLVQAAIDLLMEGRTVLVIAHRLATIRRANKIAVIVGGKVVEMGTHEQLLEQGGEYDKLYRIQFQDQFEHSESAKRVGEPA